MTFRPLTHEELILRLFKNERDGHAEHVDDLVGHYL